MSFRASLKASTSSLASASTSTARRSAATATATATAHRAAAPIAPEISSQLPSTTKKAPPVSQRVYTARKTFLHAYYAHWLRSSQLVLLFSHDNLTVQHLLSIRRAIAKLPPPSPSPLALATSNNPSDTSARPDTRATLTISRTGLLSSLFKPHLQTSLPDLRPYLLGPTALLTSPSLSPAYVSKLLSTIARAIKSAQKEVPPNTALDAVKQPKLQLVAGILEGGRLVGVEEMAQVGKLPEIDVLRAQVVGLLEGQGRGLLGVLSQAGGGGLVRTLQGLEEGMKSA